MILAASGVPVFKHGNRSITSGCGSADLLERLGVSLLGAEGNHEKALEKLNFTFFFCSILSSGFQGNYASTPSFRRKRDTNYF